MMLELTNVARPFLSIPVIALVLAVAAIVAYRLLGPRQTNARPSS
jgi:NADH:ubiquinone oxidoreductase subunit 3 (subunit A)